MSNLGLLLPIPCQIERQLQSGSLTEKERDVLIEQLDRLYELQRQKEAQKKGSDKNSEAQTDSKSAVPSHQTSLHSSDPNTGGQLSVHNRPRRGRPHDTSYSAVAPMHPRPLHDMEAPDPTWTTQARSMILFQIPPSVLSLAATLGADESGSQ